MSQIHATAIIHPSAKLGEGVSVGPYSVVGEHVILEKNVTLHSHVVVEGRTSIGEGTVVFPFASLGHAPQDLKYKGEPSTLVIGKRNTIREHVTMNPGTEGDKMTTWVGDDCLFMTGAHVAHDCVVGNRVILANNATLAGHVQVGDFAILGGLSAVHQFVRIGSHAIIGGLSGVEHDVIPYGSVMGERGWLAGLNIVGMRRSGLDREAIHSIRAAFRDMFEDGTGTLAERTEKTAGTYASSDPVQEIIAFIRTESSRSLCVPRDMHLTPATAE